MMFIANFERIEKKYLATEGQLRIFQFMLKEYMEADQYGETTICNLYLDTADDLLVRRSIEKPKYKEKMRLRSYGVPEDSSPVYLEIKKKAGGVVYKRRIDMTAGEAMAYLAGGRKLEADGQIAREIEYMRGRYSLRPKLYLAYDRIAYRELIPSDHQVRVTVDHSIRSRDTDVDLRLGDAGKLLMPEGTYLLEVKTAGAYPLWLSAALTAAELYPTSFSKYGQIYQERVKNRSTLTAKSALSDRKPLILGGFTNAYSPV